MFSVQKGCKVFPQSIWAQNESVLVEKPGATDARFYPKLAFLHFFFFFFWTLTCSLFCFEMSELCDRGSLHLTQTFKNDKNLLLTKAPLCTSTAILYRLMPDFYFWSCFFFFFPDFCLASKARHVWTCSPFPVLGRFMSPPSPLLPLLFVFWGGLKSDMPSNIPSQHLSANPLERSREREICFGDLENFPLYALGYVNQLKEKRFFPLLEWSSCETTTLLTAVFSQGNKDNTGPSVQLHAAFKRLNQVACWTAIPIHCHTVGGIVSFGWTRNVFLFAETPAAGTSWAVTKPSKNTSAHDSVRFPLWKLCRTCWQLNLIQVSSSGAGDTCKS